MNVLSLHLLNFRGIETLHVDFTQRTTAFVGVNGVGKSAILDALAIALSQLIWRLNNQPQKARQIAPDDIRHGADFARIAITLQIRPGVEIQWALARNRKSGTYPDPLRKSDLEALNRAVSALDAEWEQVESERQEPYDLPLAVYYDVNRSVLEIPIRVREKLQNTPYEVYRDALDHGGADFKRFFIWFRNREDYENEQRRDQPDFRDRALEAVRAAVAAFTGFQDLRIRRSPLRMTVVKQGLELNVAQLSDGERNMLALLGDMARRLSVLNPSLTNPNAGHGVVLIDEIDLHLHPGWQRRVIGSLERTFPNCQFIVTTHSPQIVGELAPESVMRLRDGVLLGHAPRSLGLSSGEVLEELMDGQARNPEVSAQLEAIHRQIDDDRLTDAQTLLDQLQAKVGDIPEVLAAQASIDSLACLEDEET
ncbi:AAA family ATPase [Allochromatium vinosum]|uniref:AAA family ATPase n=1 Tax=Allochromatium vinosum TaxID=1049 RepID=UPI001908F5F2|nr:AAA family ATPase [Allochromatium vinosum]MBK1656251.1 chromosome segregation protein SMC [Allochromatium vinosum]